jgi:hypothetical protein
LSDQQFDRVLAVLRGIADVVFPWAGNQRKAFFERGNDAAGIVHRQRGLRDKGEIVFIIHLEIGNLRGRFDQINAAIALPHRAFHFRMPGVADHDDFLALPTHPQHFDMHLGHQRAGRVEHRQAARFGLAAHRLRHTVRAENQDAAGRHIGQILDEYRAFPAQIIHDEFIVHHLVAHIDRRTVQCQRALDDGNGTIHTGAETARISQQQIHVFSR